MIVIKLILVCCRWIAASVCSGCLYFACLFLLQGVAQLDPTGEGLAKSPETVEESWSRLQLIGTLLAAGICGSVVFQATSVFSGQWRGVVLSRARKAAFAWLVFWAIACLFIGVLILAASIQARWQVATVYWWLAGGAGVMTLVLLGAADFFAPGKQGETTEPGGAPGSPGAAT